jgi:hypothetical protein
VQDEDESNVVYRDIYIFVNIFIFRASSLKFVDLPEIHLNNEIDFIDRSNLWISIMGVV